MSEVARLRKQIELECQAMHRALEGYAEVALHEFIRRKHENLEKCRQDLISIVGEIEANRISAAVYFKALEETIDVIEARE